MGLFSEMMDESGDLKAEIHRLRIKLNEATILIEDLLGLELGSSERAMAFLDAVKGGREP
jgi:hypothetical protein